jgi:hypothetical protein
VCELRNGTCLAAGCMYCSVVIVSVSARCNRKKKLSAAFLHRASVQDHSDRSHVSQKINPMAMRLSFQLSNFRVSSPVTTRLSHQINHAMPGVGWISWDMSGPALRLRCREAAPNFFINNNTPDYMISPVKMSKQRPRSNGTTFWTVLSLLTWKLERLSLISFKIWSNI